MIPITCVPLSYHASQSLAVLFTELNQNQKLTSHPQNIVQHFPYSKQDLFRIWVFEFCSICQLEYETQNTCHIVVAQSETNSSTFNPFQNKTLPT